MDVVFDYEPFGASYAFSPIYGAQRSADRLFRYRGANGLGNRVLQIMWTGAKYAVTDDLDVIGAYYHYIQNSWFGTPTGGPAFCSDSSHAQCAGTYDAISAAVDWRFAPKWDLYFGMMFNQVHGGLGFGSCTIPRWGVRYRF